MDESLKKYWNGIEVEILKEYPIFNKVKICFKNKKVMIVDKSSLTDFVENTIPIEYIDGRILWTS